jgi:hypothetical protein
VTGGYHGKGYREKLAKQIYENPHTFPKNKISKLNSS